MNVTVTVYSTGSQCVHCTRTLRCLAAAGIPFEVIDLAEERHAQEREFVAHELGYTEAPVVVVDHDPARRWSGFRPDLIRDLADLARAHPGSLESRDDHDNGLVRPPDAALDRAARE